MDLDAFKTAVGEFATGVAVVTGAKDGVPYGFTVQTFVSLSLKPALVSVCPAKTAASWPEIRGSGHFCVNILSKDQSKCYIYGFSLIYIIRSSRHKSSYINTITTIIKKIRKINSFY